MSDRKKIFQELTAIFHAVFDDERITLSDITTAADIPAWDSVNHINLVISVEQKFKLRFNTSEVARMKNVGEFVDAIIKKSAP